MTLARGDEAKKEVLQLGKHHYHPPVVEVEETEAVLPVVNEPEMTAPAVDETVPEVEPVVNKVDPTVTGEVVGCSKLNVRRAPSVNATVVCEIDRDSVVIINESRSNAEWYSVCTAAGVNGFCMKKYIAISQ